MFTLLFKSSCMFCLKKKKKLNIKGQKGVLPRLDNLVLGLLSVHKKKKYW